MKNLSKKLSSFFAAFAMVFTMGTAATTTSAEATCHNYGGCYNSCSTLKYYENKYRRLANHYRSYPYYYNYYTNKANYYRDRYNRSCTVTPKTGTVCGYVFINGTADKSDGMPVTITQSDGRLLKTRVNSKGKWSISNVRAGIASIYVDERHVKDINQTYGQNSSTVTVVPNRLNDGGVDIFETIIRP